MTQKQIHFFLNLINSNQGSITRYTYFYLGYLIDK